MSKVSCSCKATKAYFSTSSCTVLIGAGVPHVAVHALHAGLLAHVVPDKHAHFNSSPPSPHQQFFLPIHLAAGAMADRPGSSLPAFPRPARPRSGQASYSPRWRVQPSNAQLLIYLALAVTLAALLVLTGVTLTVASVVLVVLAPLLLLISPLWAPVAVVAIVAGGALLFGCSLTVFALGAGTWAHRHLTGRHPVGARRAGYAYGYARGRGRFAGAGGLVTGYHGQGQGYDRMKDAVPGA